MRPFHKPVRILKAYGGPLEWHVYDPGEMPTVATPEFVEFRVGDTVHGVLQGVHETDDSIWLTIEDTGAA